MKKTNHIITQNQYIFLLVSAVIGIGIISAPNSLCQTAEQSGWIAIMLGGIYPLVISYCAYLNYKYFGNMYFFELNKKLYGKIGAYLVFFFFFCTILFYEASIIAGFTNLLNSSISSFLPVYLIIFILTFVTVFTAYFGLQTVGRLAEIIFYSSSILFLFPLLTFSKGNIVNILPVISSYHKIIESIPSSFYAYADIELAFFIMPFVLQKNDFKKAGIKASTIIIVIYTFLVFTSIYILGYEVASKIYFTLIYLMEVAEIPIITDFKAIFIFLWSGVVFKAIACNHFVVSYTFSKLTKLTYKKSCLIVSPFILGVAIAMIPAHGRTQILDKIVPYIVPITILYSIITAIMVLIKGRRKL
ncbi:MAG: spore germination protein [Clostridiales bacterium]|nr:spore germination protein [Clostridiales bacterium]